MEFSVTIFPFQWTFTDQLRRKTCDNIIETVISKGLDDEAFIIKWLVVRERFIFFVEVEQCPGLRPVNYLQKPSRKSRKTCASFLRSLGCVITRWSTTVWSSEKLFNKSLMNRNKFSTFLKVNLTERPAKKLREDYQKFPPSLLASFYHKI